MSTWTQPAPTKRFAVFYEGAWYGQGETAEAAWWDAKEPNQRRTLPLRRRAVREDKARGDSAGDGRGVTLLRRAGVKPRARRERQGFTTGDAAMPCLTTDSSNQKLDAIHELPDELRVPLHELQADMEGLFAWVVVDAYFAPIACASVLNKLSQIETACYRLQARPATLKA